MSGNQTKSKNLDEPTEPVALWVHFLVRRLFLIPALMLLRTPGVLSPPASFPFGRACLWSFLDSLKTYLRSYRFPPVFLILKWEPPVSSLPDSRGDLNRDSSILRSQGKGTRLKVQGDTLPTGIGYWLLVIGYWLLVIGYSLLVICYLSSVIGDLASNLVPGLSSLAFSLQSLASRLLSLVSSLSSPVLSLSSPVSRRSDNSTLRRRDRSEKRGFLKKWGDSSAYLC